MFKDILRNPTFVAFLTFILGLASAFIIIKLRKRQEHNQKTRDVKDNTTKSLLHIKREVEHNVDATKCALVNNYQEFIQGSERGYLLVEKAKLVYPKYSKDYRFYYDKFDLSSILPIGLDRMIRHFYGKISNLNSSDDNNDFICDCDQANTEIFTMMDAAYLGNELTYQLEWVIKEIENPEEIKSFKDSGIKEFSGTYEGTWAVPWLETIPEKDKTFSRFQRHYESARNIYKEIGLTSF